MNIELKDFEYKQKKLKSLFDNELQRNYEWEKINKTMHSLNYMAHIKKNPEKYNDFIKDIDSYSFDIVNKIETKYLKSVDPIFNRKLTSIFRNYLMILDLDEEKYLNKQNLRFLFNSLLDNPHRFYDEKLQRFDYKETDILRRLSIENHFQLLDEWPFAIKFLRYLSRKYPNYKISIEDINNYKKDYSLFKRTA